MEEWRAIKGYEGYYWISNLGNVKSKYRQLKPIKAPSDSYSRVRLSKNNQIKQYNIHRLVAETFIENSLNLPYVNHINGDKLDNRVENLEWCNASHNTKHSYDNNLQKKPKGELNSQAKLTWNEVREIRHLSNSCKRKELAKLYNVSIGTINDIVNYRTWKEGGLE